MFLIISCPFKKPFVGTKIASELELSDRAVITLIQTDNKNKKRQNLQSDKTEGLEQCGINFRGRKKAQFFIN